MMATADIAGNIRLNNNMGKKSVVIAFGGVSPEHEVSVLTAMQALSALEESPFEIRPLYISKTGKWYTGDYLLKLEHYKNLDKVIDRGVPCTLAHNEYSKPVLRELKTGFLKKSGEYAIDVMLIAFHGSGGENGSFQGLCEILNIPYTGCNVLSSAIGMDKVTAKTLCRAHGIPVVEDCHFYESGWGADPDSLSGRIEKMGYPVIVKPVNLGSSIGVARAEDRNQLSKAVEEAFRYDEHLLVEKAVDPLMEINCSVLGSSENCRVSVCERPASDTELLSFRDKYQNDAGGTKGMASAERVIPADISGELTGKIQDVSKKIFTVFRGNGVVRLDFLVNADTLEFYFNEINTIPGSFSFYLWEETGSGFGDILQEIIDLAVRRHARKNGRVLSYETNLLSQKAASGLKGLKGPGNTSKNE